MTQKTKLTRAYFISKDNSFRLFNGDSFKILPKINESFDMVFTDPPYFLSNDGFTIKSGKISSVNKGSWDRLENNDQLNVFNETWISSIRNLMKDSATIWISGTSHNIFSIGNALKKLDFKILNIITWEKINPPPNFSTRTFVHSTEHIIWARKHEKTAHYFDYDLMKQINNSKQMKDFWRFSAAGGWENNNSRHPTQKPLSLLCRIILASTKIGDSILDPFAGSSTTGIAANLLGRNYVGIEREKEYLDLSKQRKIDIQKNEIFNDYLSKLSGVENSDLEQYFQNPLFKH